MNRLQIIQANAFHSPKYGKIEFLENVLFCVDAKGVIQDIIHTDHPDYLQVLASAKEAGNLQTYPKGSYLLPGFIDLHVHAPQWPQAGVALDRPLYDWLNQCTFPLEARYADLDFAREVYTDLVHQLLQRGTTTVLYFGSIHSDSCLELAKACIHQGQRGLVGKVVMDDPKQNPEYYRDSSTQEALAETERFILKMLELNQSAPQGVYPVVTPRFIPSCTDEALKGLGELAQKYDVHIQSHCSESDWEHEHVHTRFGKTDSQALHDFGLLGKKSVMAHCTFLGEDGAKLFAKTGTAIAHCPISNAYFGNSVLPTASLQKLGVDIGLGTDISGGFSPSLYDNLKQAVISSRMLEDGVDSTKPPEERGLADSRISIIEAFWHATTGGGKALSLPIGQFKKEFAFDAQVVQIDSQNKSCAMPDFGLFNSEEEILQKILYLATPQMIREVWVQGKKVYTNH